MSIPTTVEAIAVIILIFIPGYIFLQFTKGAVAFIPQSVDARYFFAVITWGGLVHLATAWSSIPLLRWYQDHQLEDHLLYAIVWSILVLVVFPLLLGILGAWIIQQPKVDGALAHIGMDYVSRTPSAWNFATKSGAAWVRVHLKDGTVIGGVYEDHSFADDAGEKDMFLERVYNLTDTGDFSDPVAGTAGVWIPHDVISHVMFFTAGKEASNGGVSDNDRPPTQA